MNWWQELKEIYCMGIYSISQGCKSIVSTPLLLRTCWVEPLAVMLFKFEVGSSYGIKRELQF